MLFRLRPFLPPALFRTRAFVVISGLVSVFLLLFALCVHATLIYGQTAYTDIDSQLAWFTGFLTTPIKVFWIAMCLAGPAISIAMLDHLLQNTRLSPSRRSLWAVANLTGFGMVFYWYFHLFRMVATDGDPVDSQ